MNRVLLILAAAFVSAQAIAADLTANVGVKTYSGFGGICIAEAPGSIISGTGASDWAIDSAGCVVPSGTYSAVKTYSKSAGQTYNLTLSSGRTIDITLVAATAHVTSTAADTSANFQLATMLNKAYSAAGAVKLGDTLVIRDGAVVNPNAGDWRIKPSAGGWGGGGTITAAGSGYTNGTFNNVALTGGSGAGATALIVVASNQVKNVHINYPGSGYHSGDVLSASLGGGSGFQYTVTDLAARITIRSETPNFTTDANGNPRRGGGAQIGALNLDGGNAGNILFPLDFRYIDFTFGTNTSSKAHFLRYASVNGYGASAYESRFANDNSIISPSNAQGFEGMWVRGGVAKDNHFRFFGWGVKGGLTGSPWPTRVEGNVFERMISDAIQLGGNNIVVADNFIWDFDYVTGAHSDGHQHAGFQGTKVSGSGYTTGTQTCPSTIDATPPIATNCYLSVPLTNGSSSGVLADMQVGSGGTIGTIVIKTIGDLPRGISTVLTIDPSAPAGLLTGSGFSYTTVGAISNIATVTRNVVVLGETSANASPQGFFYDDTTDTGALDGIEFSNNITILGSAHGITGAHFRDPIISRNTILTTGLSYAGVLTQNIALNSGSGGVLSQNISTGYLSQSGQSTPAGTNPTLAKTGGSYTTTYQAWFQNWTESIKTRAQAIGAVTPILNGPAKNAADGTYNGALFPDGSWNDGTVYNLTPATAVTASVPATTMRVGDTLTITYQLDAAITGGSITITPGLSGVTGNFSPDPLTITLGGVSGTIGFSPTSAGTATIQATNNRSLVNPVPIVVTVLPAVEVPTDLMQSATPMSTSIGAAVTVTYTINAPATQVVTLAVTSDKQIVASTSSPIIPAGQTATSITVYPLQVGPTNLSVTNDRGLSNPSPVTLNVSAMSRGQLEALGIR